MTKLSTRPFYEAITGSSCRVTVFSRACVEGAVSFTNPLRLSKAGFNIGVLLF